MLESTDINVLLQRTRKPDATCNFQVSDKNFRPLELLDNSMMTYGDIERVFFSMPTSAERIKKSFEVPIPNLVLSVVADSAPLQIWEGTVKRVDHEANIMHVILDAKMGSLPRHTADIDLEWVSEQDQDLVCTGAVFYLTLFKRTKRGSIENSQELRFRRRPSWTKTQLKDVDDGVSKLFGKITALPTAE